MRPVEVGSDEISIHAPLTGSDFIDSGFCDRYTDFNPRSPYGERPRIPRATATCIRFQSTLPLRGATWGSSKDDAWKADFNPRSPYGERRLYLRVCGSYSRFQSTLPLRGATFWLDPTTYNSWISIHAPLTGSDSR